MVDNGVLSSLLRKRVSEGELDLYVLGSSSSEAFDYAIGRRSTYHPFWAGAWSARVLRDAEMQDYIAHILRRAPRESHILLNFGLADVLFNARYKAVTEGFYDFDLLVREAAEGILLTVRNLHASGFRSVRPIFISPVPNLGQKYWQGIGPGRQLPNPLMGMMYHGIFSQVAKEAPCVDVFDELSQGASRCFLLRPEFHRQEQDHHPDYIKMHEIIRDKLFGIPGTPPCREKPLEAHYPYHDIWITTLRKRGRTRRSTCC
ncbi:hypothetical protein [Paracoccus beibuensis]|uniref:hypothetical protein n=1 Tax=Paracoccus beibuensis TaxID=547602 RepID=UPI0022404532|nr:hypothetical protein [Paracoccus beibuensis]